MEDIVNFSWDMDKLSNVVMVKFEIFELE